MSLPRWTRSAGCSAEEFPATAAGYPGRWPGLAGSGPCVGRDRGDRQLRRGPDPSHHYGGGSGRRGRPFRPPGPPPQGKSDPLDGQRRPGGPVGPGPRRVEGPGRRGRGHPSSHGRQASGSGERTQTINQARALILTGPEDCGPASPGTRWRPWSPGWPRYVPGPAAPSATPPASRWRAGTARGVPRRPDRAPRRAHRPPREGASPGLLALFGIGPNTAALLLIAAGDHPERLRSEAAWAHLCAVAPIPASSGSTSRHGSTAAVTARPTTLCGGSCSPAWAPTRPPAPTPSAAPPGKIQNGDHSLPETLRRP